MAKDPVCGMNVDESSPHSSTHAGVTYYFCSASCKTKFDEAPERYTKQSAGGGEHAGHHHHCC
jgi:YHS domain-containing protein